jgi:GTP-binding protein
MRFVDDAEIFVRGGRGGDGAIAFLREKYRPWGGPAGGDGGRGGNVILQADESCVTLLDFLRQPRLIAKDGEHGRGNDQNGRAGADLVVKAPVGTMVFDAESDAVVADLTTVGQRAIVAHGGRGGLGNRHFASSTLRAPRIATPGCAGEQRRLRLELRLIAEVGLAGLPNAGKSTLLGALTGARPKVASYPFTTVVPNLGRVVSADDQSFTIADIPGLIQGAHLGHGLGVRFLRHLRRTQVLVFVVDISGHAEHDLGVLKSEIEAFDPELLARPSLIALNKMDLLPRHVATVKAEQMRRKTNIGTYAISARNRQGLEPLLAAISLKLRQTSRSDVAARA